MKYLLLFLLALLIFIIAATLGVRNDQMVTLNYLVGNGEFRLSLLLAVLFGLGAIIGWSICALFYLRLRWRMRGQQKKLKQLQQLQGCQSDPSSSGSHSQMDKG